MKSPAEKSRKVKAFTMIELLTVIAIIAILSAIIFPVFAQLRENSRRSNTISNMQRISSALRQYKLDNRTYPDYLFGPVLYTNGDPVIAAGVPLNEIMSMTEIAGILRAPTPSGPGATQAQKDIAAKVKREYKNSLFPGYINDLAVFSCPNNLEARIAGDKSYAVVQRYIAPERGDRDVVAEPRAFYKYDSFDTSPAVTGADTIDKTNFQLRYSKLWMTDSAQRLYNPEGLADLQSMTPDNYQAYSRQLLFNNPSADTYITMTTYHVPNSKICVLFLNGTAKVLDTRKLNPLPGANYTEKSANAFRLIPSS